MKFEDTNGVFRIRKWNKDNAVIQVFCKYYDNIKSRYKIRDSNYTSQIKYPLVTVACNMHHICNNKLEITFTKKHLKKAQLRIIRYKQHWEFEGIWLCRVLYSLSLWYNINIKSYCNVIYFIGFRIHWNAFQKYFYRILIMTILILTYIWYLNSVETWK